MLREIFADQRQYLNFFFDSIDISQTQGVLDALVKCNGILIFTGVGKSGHIAEKLAATMISTGTKALFLPPANAMHGDIGIVDKQDIVIFLSKGGDTPELLVLAESVKKRGAKTQAWVCNEEAQLRHICDEYVLLPLRGEICPFGLAPTTSTAVQLVFGDILAVAMMQYKNFDLGQFALNHPAGSIGKMIAKLVCDVMRNKDQLPVCHEDQVLKEVLFELSAKRCGALFVLNDQDEMVGIFTDGDLRRALENNNNEILNMKITHLMTKEFQKIDSDRSVQEALNLMRQEKVMVLPVFTEAKLIGLVHMHDLLETKVALHTSR